MAADKDIENLLTDLGYDTTPARRRARQILEEASLTRAGKTRISLDKLPRIRGVLQEKLQRICKQCRAKGLAGHRGSPIPEIVEVTMKACPVCQNTNAQREFRQLIRTMEALGYKRLLIVGGTPVQHEELRRLFKSSHVEIRLVDGTSNSHRSQDAGQNLKWADVCAIWAPTPLGHKVSNLYSSDKLSAVRIMIGRRGLPSLLETITSKLEQRRKSRSSRQK